MKDSNVLVRVTSREKAEMQKIASRFGISLSELIRDTILTLKEQS